MESLAKTIVHGSIQSVAVVGISLLVDLLLERVSISRQSTDSKWLDVAILAAEVSVQMIVYGAVSAFILQKLAALTPDVADPAAGILVSIAISVASPNMMRKILLLAEALASSPMLEWLGPPSSRSGVAKVGGERSPKKKRAAPVVPSPPGPGNRPYGSARTWDETNVVRGFGPAQSFDFGVNVNSGDFVL